MKDNMSKYNIRVACKRVGLFFVECVVEFGRSGRKYKVTSRHVNDSLFERSGRTIVHDHCKRRNFREIIRKCR